LRNLKSWPTPKADKATFYRALMFLAVVTLYMEQFSNLFESQNVSLVVGLALAAVVAANLDGNLLTYGAFASAGYLVLSLVRSREN